MSPLNKRPIQIKQVITLMTAIFLLTSYAYAQDDANQQFKKGQERQQNGEYQDAIACYNRVLELDSSYYKAYLQRGFCKVAVKDYQGGVDDYTKLLNHDPKHVWGYISRGSARNRLGDYKNALDDFDQALELDPQNAEAYNNRGFSKKGLGDDAGACADWNKSKKMGNEEAKIILKNNHCK